MRTSLSLSDAISPPTTKAEASRTRPSSFWFRGFEGLIAPDEEKLVFLKPAMYLSFTYGVLRCLVCNYLTVITSLFIYSDIFLLWVFV